jgi:hypothetical protein
MRVQDMVIGRRDGFFRRGLRRFILFREAMTVSLKEEKLIISFAAETQRAQRKNNF